MPLSNISRFAPTGSTHSEPPSNQTRTHTSSTSTTISPTSSAITRIFRRVKWWRTRRSVLDCASWRSALHRASSTSTFVGQMLVMFRTVFNIAQARQRAPQSRSCARSTTPRAMSLSRSSMRTFSEETSSASLVSQVGRILRRVVRESSASSLGRSFSSHLA